MITEHTRLAQQLKMAAPHEVEVPKDNPDAAALDSLKPLKGAAFDSAYVQKVGAEGHQQAIAAFQDEIVDGQNASLKGAAREALPTIEHRYAMT